MTLWLLSHSDAQHRHFESSQIVGGTERVFDEDRNNCNNYNMLLVLKQVNVQVMTWK